MAETNNQITELPENPTLQDMIQYYGYRGIKSFEFNGERIRLEIRNKPVFINVVDEYGNVKSVIEADYDDGNLREGETYFAALERRVSQRYTTLHPYLKRLQNIIRGCDNEFLGYIEFQLLELNRELNSIMYDSESLDSVNPED